MSDTTSYESEIERLQAKVENLELENKRLLLALDASSEGVWDWHIQENTAYYNEKYFKILGYNSEDFQGRSDVLQTLLHPDDKDLTNEKIYEHLNKNEPYDLRFRLKAVDGKYKWVRSRGKIVEYDKKGNAIRAIGTHTDITKIVQAENLLKEKQEFLNILFKNFPGIVWQCDANLNITNYNIDQQLSNSLRIADYVGQNLRDFRGMSGYDVIIAHHMKALDNNEVHFQIPHESKFLRGIITPIKNINGKVVSLIGVAFDISDMANALRLANEEHQRYRKLIEFAPDAILLGEISTGKIVEANTAACNLFGYTRDEMLTLYQWQLHPKELDQDARKRFNMPEAEIKEMFLSILTKSGEEVPVQITSSMIELSGNMYRLGFFRDMRDYFNINKELKEALSSRDKLFSIIAHDLRSPISGFVALSEVLVTDFETISISELHEISRSMLGSAKSIHSLLDNLLDWVKLQRGFLSVKPDINNVATAVSGTVNLFRFMAEDKRIDIINSIDSDITAYFDNDMLKTVIRNVISNSIKFTNDEGKIELKAENDGNYVKISVKDSGIGMKDEQIKSIISGDINQTPNDNYKKEGLGLFICRELIKSNNGFFDIRSTLGKGTEFIIRIPKEKTK